jgi:hypothetical protein
MLAQKLALQRSRAEELNESFIASKDDSLPPTPDSSKSDAFLFPSNAESLIKSNAANLSKRSLEPIENESHLFPSVNHNVSTSFSKSATGAISETEVDDAIDGDDEEDYDIEEILRSGNVPAAVKEDPLYLEMRRKQRLAKRKRDAKLLKKQGKIAQARQQTVRDIKEDGILSSTSNQLVPVNSVSNTHGETQFVPGGAMSAGFTYGTVKGGRFGRFIRKAADILKETEAKEAEEIIVNGEADMVALARGMLYDARWPWHAAAELGASVKAPKQYWRSQPRGLTTLFGDAKTGGR